MVAVLLAAVLVREKDADVGAPAATATTLTEPAALVAATDGSGGFELPFVVQGHWDDPVMLPDARSLIRRGSSLADAAAAAGFADQSHMTRLFVRAYGVSPRRYALAAG